MRKQLMYFLQLSVLLVLFMANNVIAYEDKITHPALTKNAVENSQLDLYLKNQLGLSAGVSTIFSLYDPTMKVLALLQKGSTDEDALNFCRASNHFHNPRLTWDQSYMTDAPALAKKWCHDIWPTWAEYSNISWATGQVTRDGAINSRTKQDMGWDTARAYLYSALTSTTSTDRETNFAKTFQAVGQVMHLLQDMAVPAHVSARSRVK